MKPSLLFRGFLLSALVGSVACRADEKSTNEARVAVYVGDRSAEKTETGGTGLPYTAMERTGPTREILAIAKGSPGSTVFMIAFDRDAPHLGLAPVIAEQTGDSKPTRFPGEGAKWPFEKPANSVDLYVAVFDKADPERAKLVEYAEWLTDALKEKNEVEALLHAEVIKKRLTNLLRQREVGKYRVKYGDLTSLQEQSTSKAVTTRGNTDPLLSGATRELKASLAAVRRGLKTLDDEWLEDSRAIPYDPKSAGILIFPITTPPAL